MYKKDILQNNFKKKATGEPSAVKDLLPPKNRSLMNPNKKKRKNLGAKFNDEH